MSQPTGYGKDATKYGEDASRLPSAVVNPLTSTGTSNAATTTVPPCRNGATQISSGWEFVPEIRGIMQNLDWKVSAKSQDMWINGPPRQLVGEQKFGLDQQGQPLRIERVDINWVISIDRAVKVFNELARPDVFLNDEARKVLTNHINQKLDKNTNAQEIEFGNYAPGNPRDLENEYCNQRALGYVEGVLNAPLDDFFGSIARCTFFVIPRGKARQQDQNVSVEVNEIGIYMRDSFDFNDDIVPQYLGNWKKPNLVEKSPLKGDNLKLFPRCTDEWFAIFNSDYRNYRENRGKGEDFIIYSDVKSFQIQKIVFEYRIAL